MEHKQLHQIVGFYLMSMLMLLTLLPPAHVASYACNACGPECATACGTAMFRACCFNYNRKRSAVPPLEESMLYDMSRAGTRDPFRVDYKTSDSQDEALGLERWLFRLLGRLAVDQTGQSKESKKDDLGY